MFPGGFQFEFCCGHDIVLPMGNKKSIDQYSDEETARRRDELAQRMLNMPPRPLKPKSKDDWKANPPKKRGRSKREKARNERFNVECHRRGVLGCLGLE
jgi:hypothetical protein